VYKLHLLLLLFLFLLVLAVTNLTEYERKPALVVLKGVFSRRIFELKLTDYQILKLARE
jgi:hypothetical protein